jgi:signal peptidase
MGKHSGEVVSRSAAVKRTSANRSQADQTAETPTKKTLLRTIGTGLSMGLFAIVLAVMVVAVIIPKVTGATPLTVLTSSMEPALPPGTLLIVRPVDTSTVLIGDVITYQIESGQPAVVTHRVTAVTSNSDGELTFTMQGDNNDSADPPVIADQIQGRLWYSLPMIGYLSTFINGPSRVWILPVVAGAMILYAVGAIVLGLIDAAKKRRVKKQRDLQPSVVELEN